MGDVPIGSYLAEILEKAHTTTALIALRANPGISYSRLSRELTTDAHTARFVTHHLEAHGLVEIRMKPGPFNREQAVIELTSRGRDLADGLQGLLSIIPDEEGEWKPARPRSKKK